MLRRRAGGEPCAVCLQKVEVEDTKVRESTTPAVPALDQPAQAPPPVVKKGYGGGAIAATFFGGLVLGVLAIIAAVKVYRKRKIDEFYAGAPCACLVRVCTSALVCAHARGALLGADALLPSAVLKDCAVQATWTSQTAGCQARTAQPAPIRPSTSTCQRTISRRRRRTCAAERAAASQHARTGAVVAKAACRVLAAPAELTNRCCICQLRSQRTRAAGDAQWIRASHALECEHTDMSATAQRHGQVCAAARCHNARPGSRRTMAAWGAIWVSGCAGGEGQWRVCMLCLC